METCERCETTEEVRTHTVEVAGTSGYHLEYRTFCLNCLDEHNAGNI